jgi:hypothetical protein
MHYFERPKWLVFTVLRWRETTENAFSVVHLETSEKVRPEIGTI